MVVYQLNNWLVNVTSVYIGAYITPGESVPLVENWIKYRKRKEKVKNGRNHEDVCSARGGSRLIDPVESCLELGGYPRDPSKGVSRTNWKNLKVLTFLLLYDSIR